MRTRRERFVGADRDARRALEPAESARGADRLLAKLDPVTRRPWNAVEERLDLVDGLRRGRAGESGGGSLERCLASGERLGAERRQGRRFPPARADPDLESLAPLDAAARGLQRETEG